MTKKIGVISSLMLSLLAVGASAGSIPYDNIGTPAPANTFVAAADGNVTAYFYSTDAGFDSEIGLLVNGVSTGLFGLWNHGSNHGDTFVLGNVHAGDTLEFELKVWNSNNSWYSVASDNSDGLNHTYSTNFGGDALIPVGTYVAFEDLPFLGDLDYNDHQFVFSNVKNTSQLPEPGSLGLVALGLVALGYARKRKA